MLKNIIIVLINYILGCINTGYYYVLLRYRSDIRTIGTNVTGATNVGRLAGKRGFIITFFGDFLKGILAVLLLRYFKVSDMAVLCGIFMVIAGHILPIQLKFKGGKGFSTWLGAFLTFDPVIVAIAAVTSGILLLFIRELTITGLFALCLLPVELIFFRYNWKTIIIVALCGLLILYACRNNLKEYFDHNKKKE